MDRDERDKLKKSDFETKKDLSNGGKHILFANSVEIANNSLDGMYTFS